MEGIDADGLQISDAAADGVRRVGASELKGVMAFVDGGVAGGAAKLEISEAPLPLLVETTPELLLRLLDFLQYQLEIRFHGSPRALQTG